MPIVHSWCTIYCMHAVLKILKPLLEPSHSILSQIQSFTVTLENVQALVMSEYLSLCPYLNLAYGKQGA